MSNLIDSAILILSSYQTIPFKESTLTTLKRECIDVFRRNKSKELQEGKKNERNPRPELPLFPDSGEVPETSCTVLITFISATNETLFITMSTSNLKGSKPAMTGWSVFFSSSHSLICMQLRSSGHSKPSSS